MKGAVQPLANDSRAWREASLSLLVGLAASAVAVVPASLRLAGAGGSAVLGFLTYWGALALGLGALALGVNASAALAIDEQRFRPWLSIALTAALSVTPLTIVARVLKTTTHHRPLGAVVFAWLALGSMLGIFVVARRVLVLARSKRKPVAGALGVAALLSVAYPLVSLLSATLSARSALLDLLLVSGSVVATLRLRPAPLLRVPARAVWLGWLLIVVGGFLSGQILGVDAWQNAPLLAGALGGLSL